MQTRDEMGCGSSTAPRKTKPTAVFATKSTEVFFNSIRGFRASRNAVNTTAKTVLPHKYMDAHPNFVDQAALVQRTATGEKVGSLEQLQESAALALPVFIAFVTKVVLQAGLEPSAVAMHEGSPLVLDRAKGLHFCVLTLAPPKSEERCREKAENEYAGDYSLLVDVTRCSIVCSTEEQLQSVAQALGKAGDGVKVVRLKNRFLHPLFNGYRDALYNVAVRAGEGGAWHVCEVQLHLAAVLSHKEVSHGYYEFFRSYFKGNVGAAEERMGALDKLLQHGEQDINQLTVKALQSKDQGLLRNLVTLFQMMGEVQLVVPCEQRLVALASILRQKRVSSLPSRGWQAGRGRAAVPTGAGRPT
jgi:hypothetical protein